MSKDIIDKLKDVWWISPTTAEKEAEEVCKEAANTITNLRNALHRIGFDYVELSYDKIVWQYHDHMKIAKKAYQDSFPPEEKTEPKPLDDNF
jgi:hypothetical protein